MLSQDYSLRLSKCIPFSYIKTAEVKTGPGFSIVAVKSVDDANIS